MPIIAKNFRIRGKLFKNHNQYIKLLISKYRKGHFKKSVNLLRNAISNYIVNKKLIKIHRKKSIQLFKNKFSIYKRNKFLLKNYLSKY